MRLTDLIIEGTRTLSALYPEREAREMVYATLEKLLGTNRHTHILEPYYKVTDEDILQVREAFSRMASSVPLQYVLKEAWFYGRKFNVSPDVLIPRPETAELVAWVLQMADRDKSLRVLDIGTGSGCIALALKKAAPRWQVTGVDISQEALEVAKENALRNHVAVNWLQLDILSGIADNLLPISDVIISNPPYICDSERKDMAARVLDYEPHSALFVPDSDPLLFYRRIATLVNLSATRGGDPQAQPIYLFFEINEAYGDAVCDMLRGMGYMDVQLKNDIYGKPRMVFGAVAR